MARKPRELQIHPAAELMPPMAADQYASLKADIAVRGMTDAIELLGGKIIDGVHRYRICRELNLPPRTRAVDDSVKGDPAWYVYSKATRRDMTAGQKAVAAAALEGRLGTSAMARRIANLKQFARSEPEKSPDRGASRDVAASFFGVNPRYVSDAKLIARRSRALFDQLRRGELNIPQAKHRLKIAENLKRAAKRAAEAGAMPATARVIVGDCVAVMRAMEAGCARVVFTDPPYNQGYRYNADPTRDDLPPEEYLAWCRDWMREAARVLADDGSLFVMINGGYAARFEMILRELHLFRRETLYWWENNPQHNPHNFSSAVRQVHYFT